MQMNKIDLGMGENSFKGWVVRYTQTPSKYDKNPIRPRKANLTLRLREQEEAIYVAETKRI